MIQNTTMTTISRALLAFRRDRANHARKLANAMLHDLRKEQAEHEQLATYYAARVVEQERALQAAAARLAEVMR